MIIDPFPRPPIIGFDSVVTLNLMDWSCMTAPASSCCSTSMLKFLRGALASSTLQKRKHASGKPCLTLGVIIIP